MSAYLAAPTRTGRISPRRWLAAGTWWLACVFVWLLSAGSVFAQEQPIPALQQRITDTTGTLDAETQARLTQTLAGLEQRKGAQIAVLMIPTTGDEDIAQYAVRAFEQWKLGRADVDDGILFLVAKDDRRLRIEVGYGLEGAVPDLLAGRIIREQVAPRFQQGDFAGGVEAGVNSLVGLVDGEDLPPATEAAGQENNDIFATIVVLLFLALMMPPVLSVLAVGVFTYFLFDSVVAAVLGGMAALLLSLAGRSWVGRGSGASASRRGGAIGTMGGISAGRGHHGGFGGGGFGGGGFGGGGGSSGGGGASGSW
ncbi:MAG TPA: YgcG family protein [Pusillimonas sp.]|uniref:TPM domain-containing protein n=1 Tax=Pusillimonas sp. TaxID=3040095 RepID=UPI002C06A833|nr:YgcG family protein [Pusillimonas sp.]HUH86526.1 YgcG family protein [Pusillimonas sp.]